MSDEYPKAIVVDGVPLTVTDAADEARWTQPAAVTTTAPEPFVAEVPIPDVLDDPDGVPAANPLDDLELDGAALNDGHVPEPESSYDIDADESKPTKKPAKKK